MAKTWTPEQDSEGVKNHTAGEDRPKCPDGAEGIVAYWLQHRNRKGTAEIFEEYFSQRMREFVDSHKNDPDAWERNLEEEFTQVVHIPVELDRIERTTEAIKEQVGQKDFATINVFAESYLRFVRRKSRSLFPPKYPEHRKIEDEFLHTFDGPARECADWIREEYDIPYMRPDRFSTKTEPKKRRRRTSAENAPWWKRQHGIVVPRYVRWGFEDYNSDVLNYADGGLMEEIEVNLRSYGDKEDRIRYVVSLLMPFRELADAFYPLGRIRQKEREIETHTRDVGRWRKMQEDSHTGTSPHLIEQIEAGERMIENCQKDIEYWKKSGNKFYDIVQGVFGKNGAHGTMEYYLFEFWSDMIHFARRLAALLLTFHIKLPDVQERCGIYLMWHYDLFDYEDMKYIPDMDYARKLLEEIEQEKPAKGVPESREENPEAGQSLENTEEEAFDKVIFHDNLDEDQIAQALLTMGLNGCGEKQFTLAVKEFFESIGWLVNMKDTDFVSWMKSHEIVKITSKGLTHVKRRKEMDKLTANLQKTFQYVNGKNKWEDNSCFYKKNRRKINNGV